MKLLLNCLMAMLIVPAIHGQKTKEKSAGKMAFSSINQVGVLTGAAGESATIQTINGVQINKWFTGIGAGINYYGMRSIPVFADVRKTFGNKPNSPFVYADAGVNFPWETSNQLQQKGYEKSDIIGPFYDVGVGYKLSGKHNRAILISAGYSYKKMRNQSPMYSILPWPRPVTPNYETYTNHFRTIVVKVGVQL